MSDRLQSVRARLRRLLRWPPPGGRAPGAGPLEGEGPEGVDGPKPAEGAEPAAGPAGGAGARPEGSQRTLPRPPIIRRSLRWPRLPWIRRSPRWPRLPLPKRPPRLPGGLRLWITCVSVGFLVAALFSHGRQMRQYQLDPQGWLWLLLGVGCCLLSLVVSGLAWVVILRWLGLRPRSTPVVTLYIVTNLRKFLPGGIWHLASRVQALRQPNAALGTPATTGTALLAVLIEPLLAAAAAFALVSLGGWQGGLGALALLPLPLLAPRWLNPLLRRLERGKAGQLGLDDTEIAAEATEATEASNDSAASKDAESAVFAGAAPAPFSAAEDSATAQFSTAAEDSATAQFSATAPLSAAAEFSGAAKPAESPEAPGATGGGRLRAGRLTAYPWLPLLAQLAFVLLRFAGFACCVWAFDLQQTVPWTIWLSGFAFAWTLGLVVPGAPGGLGVFEAALLLRLSLALPEPAVLAVALSYRLVVTFADLLAAGLAGLDEKIASRDPGWPAPLAPLEPPPPPSLEGPSA